MANSVLKDPNGPLWALGNVVVVTPGTQVNLMVNVDSTNINAPGTPTSYGGSTSEYTVRAQQITFQGFKAGGAGRLVPNTGNVYICRIPSATGGGITDVGCVLWILQPGQTWNLGSAAVNKNVYSPYHLTLDADNAGDAAQVTLNIA